MHTHFTQLYLAGNFPYLTNVVRISGREWGPTRPSHHLNLFPFILFCHFGQSEQSLTKCNVFPISQMSCIVTYSSESQSSPVQLITLKATYLPNILRMRVNLLPTQNDIQLKILPHTNYTHTKIHTICPRFHMNMLKWWYIIVTCSVNYFYGLSRRHIQLMQ